MNIFKSTTGNTPFYKAVFNMLLVCVLLIGLFWVSLSKIGIHFNFSFIRDYRTALTSGFLTTVYISLASLVLSLTLGLISAIMHQSNIIPLRYFAKLYVGVIRGTPLIMQIYLFYYIVGTAVGIESRFIAGVLILSIFEGAYISEIIRGSLLSLDPTQLEAAKAVGFTKKQSLQYVVLPQLIARTLPALAGQFASIIKDSSLLSMIAVIELTQTVREMSSNTFQLFESYLLLGVLYLVLTLPVTLISKRLERRFAYEN